MRGTWNFARKDLKLFAADRKGMLITLLVPIAIASFMGMVFGGQGGSQQAEKINLLVADLDKSALSNKMIEELKKSDTVNLEVTAEPDAKKRVRNGDDPVAIVIPKDFGKDAPLAMFSGEKPKITFLYDPAHSMDLQVVKGAFLQVAMQTVSQEAFASNSSSNVIGNAEQSIMGSTMADSDKQAYSEFFQSVKKFQQHEPSSPDSGLAQGMQQPFDTVDQAETASTDSSWAGVAHIFGGMAVQGVLFFGIDMAMGLLRDRRLGIWKRLKASPATQLQILSGRALSSTLVAMFVILAIFVFGFLVFKIRVLGAPVGFALVILATALMTSSFGLFISALGRTEAQSRGFSTFAVLMMAMLGGAWFPSFLMPQWVQTLSWIVPVRWAVEGFDAVTYRGLGVEGVVQPVLGLIGFSVLFTAFALFRYSTVKEG